jgi:hypothetical protein
LLKIDDITCGYIVKGNNILNGIEITKPNFGRSSLNIERLKDGRINLTEMQGLLEKGSRESEAKIARQVKKKNTAGKTKLSDMIKLPENFSVTNAEIIFMDRINPGRPHMITFENIESNIMLKLDESYSRVLNVASDGRGNINGNSDETLTWNISWNPTTPRLTLLSHFKAYDLDILSFEPYYYKQSPFIFYKGKFSGDLVFNFDNGGIGSTNEIHLAHLKFSIKEGYENASFWETNVRDLMKYFSSSSGDIVFDFKIKGDMSDPKFYLGPISKQALAAMAIDKISTAIQKATNKSASGAGSKAGQYADIISGFLKK